MSEWISLTYGLFKIISGGKTVFLRAFPFVLAGILAACATGPGTVDSRNEAFLRPSQEFEVSPNGTVASGEYLLTQNLMPVAGRRVLADFSPDLKVNGRRSAEFRKDVPLYQVTLSGAVQVFCGSIPTENWTGHEEEANALSNCLADSDNDGEFDQLYWHQYVPYSPENYQPRFIIGPDLLSEPVPYETIPVESMPPNPAYIRFDRHGKAGVSLIYGIKGSGKALKMAKPGYVELKGPLDYPVEVDMYGAKIRLLGLSGDELSFELLSPIAEDARFKGYCFDQYCNIRFLDEPAN
ncbi:MAG: hypothetical protein CMK09_01475 [Ponticaulis sp.]|nr:hypothetical protein [Ponticaulis sp.]